MFFFGMHRPVHAATVSYSLPWGRKLAASASPVYAPETARRRLLWATKTEWVTARGGVESAPRARYITASWSPTNSTARMFMIAGVAVTRPKRPPLFLTRPYSFKCASGEKAVGTLFGRLFPIVHVTAHAAAPCGL